MAKPKPVEEEMYEEDQDYEHLPIPDSTSVSLIECDLRVEQGNGLEDLPEKLASTLDHIIGQLDLITRTVSVISNEY